MKEKTSRLCSRISVSPSVVNLIILVLVLVVVSFVAAGASAQTWQDGMVSLWKFEEGSGQTTNDSEGTNDGILGQSSGDDSRDPDWTTGIGGALSYDGYPSYVYVEDSESLRFGTGSFSIQMWLKANTFVGKQPPGTYFRLIMKNGGPVTWWAVDVYDDGRIEMEMGDSNSVVMASKLSTCSMAAEQWQFLTIVVDRPNFEVRYYINDTPAGVQSLPSNFTGNLDVTNFPIHIGSGYNTIEGIVDEVALYNRALSETDISGKYAYDVQSANLTPGTPTCPELSVDIDIKPGCDPNCFHNDGNYTIPVAIFGTSTLDVHDISPSSVRLAAAVVDLDGASVPSMAYYEDLNGDNYLDLVVEIADSDAFLAEGNGTAVLSGSLLDGTRLQGSDSICVVP